MDSTYSLAAQVSVLLKPIRELAANWDINIAFELEDYVTKISQIDFGADGKQINFAEAALLIEGSAAIYSKKVEYLYSLIFKTLEQVTQQEAAQSKALRLPSSINEDGNDQDVALEDEWQFWPLDKVVEKNMASNINMEEDLSDDETFSGGSRKSNGLSAKSTVSSHQRAAWKQAFSLGMAASTSGMMGASAEPLSLDKARINGTDFRMNSCLLSSNGALMLGASMNIFSQSSSSSETDSWNPSALLHDHDDGEKEVDGGMITTDSRPNPTENLPVADDIANQFKDYGVDDDDRGYVADVPQNNDGGGGDGGDDDDYDHVDWSAVNIREAPETLNSKPAKQLRVSDRQLLHTVIDPWASYDPHDPGTVAPKPFKKGRPYRLPDLAKININNNTKPSHSLYLDFDKLKDGDEVVAGLSSLSLVYSLTKPFLPEFGYIHERETKRKAADNIKQRKEAIVALAAKEGIFVDEGDLEVEEEEPESGYNQGGSNDLQGMDNDGGDDDDDYGEWGNYGNDDDGRGYVPDNTPYNAEVVDAPVLEAAMTLEEHFQARWEEYARSTKEHVPLSDILLRVDAWQAKLAPLLEEQEHRPPFDILSYGVRLIEKFPEEERAQLYEPDKVVTAKLDDILAGAPAFEVCRSFSSMLQLANHRNIVIIPSRRADGLHDITLQLLSDKPGIDMDTLAEIPRPSGESHAPRLPYDSTTSTTKASRPAKVTRAKKTAKKAATEQQITGEMEVEAFEETVTSGRPKRPSAKKASASTSDISSAEAPISEADTEDASAVSPANSPKKRQVRAKVTKSAKSKS